MERRLSHEQPEAEEGVVLLLFRPSAATDDPRASQEAGRPRGGLRGRWASLWSIALQLTVLLLVATGLAAQTVIFAQTDGLAEAFATQMEYLSWMGGLLASCGLGWASAFLREREEDGARRQIAMGVATVAAGLALIGAALVISDLSASGAIPIP